MAKINLIDNDPKQKDFTLNLGDLLYNIENRNEIFKVIIMDTEKATLLELNTNKIVKVYQQDQVTYIEASNTLNERYSGTFLWVHVPNNKYEETIEVNDRF